MAKTRKTTKEYDNSVQFVNIFLIQPTVVNLYMLLQIFFETCKATSITVLYDDPDHSD